MISGSAISAAALSSSSDQLDSGSGGGGVNLIMRASWGMDAFVGLIPPLYDLVTDQSRILVCTVELYPKYLSDRAVLLGSIGLETGKALGTEGGAPLGLEYGSS